MGKIGFGTVFIRLNIPFNKKIKLFSSFGANAIELDFLTSTQLNEFKLTSEMIADIKRFDYVSIHAPYQEVRYKRGLNTEKIIEKLKHLCECLPIQGIVLHPDITDDFKYLENSGLPFLIENLDNKKEFGKTPEHFTKLIKECSFGFVFDAQHAFENDSTMKSGIELISIMGDRLKEMHVSGQTKSEIHYPIHASDNREAIQKILELKIKVPKILEVALVDDIRQTASKELKFVRKFEKNDDTK
jgi:hypothetical protein